MKRKKLAVVIMAGMVIAASAYTYPLAKAVFQSETTVHIQAESIENSTLIIGTHLIHMSALNDELYSIAEKSAGSSGQNELYYKSELGGGKWYNISSASSLSDITEDGKEVTNEKIEQLPLTHQTKSDGITYDLKKNIAVCIYDIADPYDLENLEELQPLYNQYELMKEREKNTELQTSNGKLVEKFFKLDVTTEQTKVYDKQLEELQKYYAGMKKEDADKDTITVVLKVMGKVDASRRKEALQSIKKSLEELQKNIRDISTVSEKEEVQASEMYDIDENLLAALLESQEKIEESLITYDGNSFAEGSTRMSKLEYDLSKSLVQNCVSNTEESDETVEKLTHLLHIMEGEVVDSAGEAALLDELVKEMQSEYKTVLEKGSTDGTGTIQTKQSELQFYVQAKAERLTVEDAQKFLEECIDKSAEFAEALPEKTAGEAMLASVDEYQNWLQELAAKYTFGTGGMELQTLREEKEKLEEQKLAALDKNQVEEAKKLQVLIDDKESKIQELQETEDSETVSVQEPKKKLLQMIETHQITEENNEEASAQIEALGVFLQGGSKAAGEALKEVYQKMAADTYLSESKAYDMLMSRIEELIADNQVTLNQNLPNEAQALKILKNILGKDMEELLEQEADSKEVQAAILSLEEVAQQTENTDLENLALSMAQTVYEQGENTGIFICKKEGTESFAPVLSLANYLGYRYVWSDTKKTAIMSKGAESYGFQAFRSSVDRGEGKREELSCSALFSGEVYIPFTYIEEKFGCKVTALGDTDYGMFADKDILEKAEEIKQELLK